MMVDLVLRYGYWLLYAVIFGGIIVSYKIIKHENIFKKNWFIIIFNGLISHSFYLLGSGSVEEKLICSIIFAFMLYPISMLLYFIIRKIFRNKIIITIVCIVACLLMFWLNSTLPNRDESHVKNRFDDVWDKDPNKWTDSEKDYVDGFFEWQKNNY